MFLFSDIYIYLLTKILKYLGPDLKEKFIRNQIPKIDIYEGQKYI